MKVGRRWENFSGEVNCNGSPKGIPRRACGRVEKEGRRWAQRAFSSYEKRGTTLGSESFSVV